MVWPVDRKAAPRLALALLSMAAFSLPAWPQSPRVPVKSRASAALQQKLQAVGTVAAITKVPQLSWLRRDEASATLERSHLAARFSGLENGIVVGQDLTPGRAVAWGSVVGVALGQPRLILRVSNPGALVDRDLVFSLTLEPPLPPPPALPAGAAVLASSAPRRPLYSFQWGDNSGSGFIDQQVAVHRFAVARSYQVSAAAVIAGRIRLVSNRLTVVITAPVVPPVKKPPPLKTPPVKTPPVKTPPVNPFPVTPPPLKTPPVKTPPVRTPPVTTSVDTPPVTTPPVTTHPVKRPPAVASPPGEPLATARGPYRALLRVHARSAASVDASVSIIPPAGNVTDYVFLWGDGFSDEVTSPKATHTYRSGGGTRVVVALAMIGGREIRSNQALIRTVPPSGRPRIAPAVLIAAVLAVLAALTGLGMARSRAATSHATRLRINGGAGSIHHEIRDPGRARALPSVRVRAGCASSVTMTVDGRHADG
jgi:hypothetical protein